LASKSIEATQLLVAALLNQTPADAERLEVVAENETQDPEAERQAPASEATELIAVEHPRNWVDTVPD
jgi:hypothetical protein